MKKTLLLTVFVFYILFPEIAQTYAEESCDKIISLTDLFQQKQPSCISKLKNIYQGKDLSKDKKTHSLYYKALDNNWFQVLDFFYEHGFDVNSSYTDKFEKMELGHIPLYSKDKYLSYYPIHRALLKWNFSLTKYLLSRGARLDLRVHKLKIRDYHDTLPIFYTLTRLGYYNNHIKKISEESRKNQLKIIELLLENGAKVNYPEAKQKRFIYAAVHSEREEVLRLILAKGAKVNSSWIDILETAIRNQNFDMVELLLDAGIDVNGSAKDSPLTTAAVKVKKDDRTSRSEKSRSAKDYRAKDNILAIIDLLLKRGANPNAVTGYQRASPLYYCVQYKNYLCTKKLLQYKANPNLADKNGDTPLHQSQSAAISLLLIQHGAKVNTQNKDGETPLHLVSTQKQAKLLLQKGANPLLEDKDGHNALMHIINKYYLNEEEKQNIIITIISAFKETLDLHNKKGDSPLLLALKRDRWESARTLILLGANISLRDREGRQAIHYASDDKTLTLLLKKGADVHSKDKEGNTPLLFFAKTNEEINYSSYNHRGNFYKVLQEHGAKMDEVNNSGKSAYYYAEENDMNGLKYYLQTQGVKLDPAAGAFRQKKLQERKKNEEISEQIARKEEFRKAFYYIGLPLLYFGASVYLNEFAFPRYSSKNPLVGINAYFLTTAVSTTFGAIFFASFGEKRPWDIISNKVFYGFFGSIGGFILGSILYMKYKEKIKYSAFSYYAMPTLALTIPFFVYRF